MQPGILVCLIGYVIAAYCQLAPEGCIDMILKDVYRIGNQTRDLGRIANTVEPNCVFAMLKLQTSTNTLINTITDVGLAINSSCPDLTLKSALPLVPALESLIPTVNKTMGIISGKKNLFDHSVLGVLSVSWLVRYDLQMNIEAVMGMAYALRSKIPTSAHAITDRLASQLLDPIIAAHHHFAN